MKLDAAYESMSASANKLLNQDGSVTDFQGAVIVPASALGAALFQSMTGMANKFLNSDGSVSTLQQLVGGGGGTTPKEGVSIRVGTVTTGAPGSNVIITNSGTLTDAVFNFTIPRGDTGQQGIQGLQGIQGPPGENAVANIVYKGIWAPGTYYQNDCVIALADGNSHVCVVASTTQEPGITGHTDWGLWVQKGPTGPQGIQGQQGLQGQQGIQGIQGPMGLTGPVGPMGPQGPAGDTSGVDVAALEARVTTLEETIGTLNQMLQAVLEGVHV